MDNLDGLSFSARALLSLMEERTRVDGQERYARVDILDFMKAAGCLYDAAWFHADRAAAELKEHGLVDGYCGEMIIKRRGRPLPVQEDLT